MTLCFQMTFYRNGFSFAISLLSTVAFVLMSVSLGSEHWVNSKLFRTSSINDFSAGNKSFGLFHGCEYKRSGKVENYNERCFDGTVVLLFMMWHLTLLNTVVVQQVV